MKRSVAMAVGLLGLVLAPVAHAENPKNRYHLFQPTPREKMRPLSLDRPDAIESPHTVDAGHFQVESSLFSYTYDARTPAGNVITNNYAIASMLLKMGLLNWLDFELGLDPYVHNQQRDIFTNTVSRASGFGDTTLRIKAALCGNDGGPFAAALLPFVVVPTNQNGAGNGRYEGGVAVPVAFDFAEGWALNGQAQFNWVQNVAETGHAAEFVNIIGLGRELSEKWGMFGEFFTQARHEEGFSWVARFDTGVTYAITENLVADVAVNIGLTRSADDVNPFVGLSYRY